MTDEEKLKQTEEEAATGSNDSEESGGDSDPGRPVDSDVEGEPTDYRASNAGVILLALYLVLTLVLSIFLLFSLMTARKTGETAGTPNLANANGAGNSNRNVNALADSNSNQNANLNAGPNTTAGNVNLNSGNGNANARAGNANSNRVASNASNGNSSAGNTNAAPADSPPPEQKFYKNDIPGEVTAYLFGKLTADSYVFLVVLFAGMMGALIRGIHSFFKHLGLGDFSFKWTWFYILLPFSGAALSLVIYLVIRGGFYSSSFGNELSLNLFSFAALAALTGLFSDNAIEKLRQVAKVLLADVPPKVENAKEILDKKNETRK